MTDDGVEASSGSSEDGRLPFDPREHGPHDVARNWHDRGRWFVRERTPWAVLSGIAVVALIAGLAYMGVSIPEVPNWMLVGLGAMIVAAPVAGFVGVRLAAFLYQPDGVLISELNAQTGDQRLIHVQPDRFDNMTVLSQTEKERDRDYLERVRINGRTAYEVDRYHEEANVAIASSMAGRTNYEVRRDRSTLDQVKTDLEEEADAALEWLANYTSHVRELGRDVSMTLIAASEDVELPEGNSLHESLSSRLDDADPLDQLIESSGGDLEDDRDTSADKGAEGGGVTISIDDRGGDGDIFDRAADGGGSDDE